MTRSNGHLDNPCSPGLLYSWGLHLCSNGNTQICLQSSPETSSCTSVLLVHLYPSTCQCSQTYSLMTLRLPRSPPSSPRLVAIHSLLGFPSPPRRTPKSSMKSASFLKSSRFGSIQLRSPSTSTLLPLPTFQSRPRAPAEQSPTRPGSVYFKSRMPSSAAPSTQINQCCLLHRAALPVLPRGHATPLLLPAEAAT